MNRIENFLNKNEIGKLEFNFTELAAADETLVASTKAALTEQAVTFTAVEVGTSGNDLDVEFVDPAGLQVTTTFGVVGTHIVVTLQHDGLAITATADSLVTDFASAPAGVTDLITVAGTGSDLLTASGPTSLADGVDNTVITCVDSSVVAPVDSITKITNLPQTVDASGIVNLFFANGEENKTYRIDVTQEVDSGRRLFLRQYVSITG